MDTAATLEIMGEHAPDSRMADILDELRHFAKGGAGDVSATCSDAAIEIERLRALIRVKALMMGMSEAEIAMLTGRQETP